jgi:histidine triad (HIT) family protein
VDASSAADFGCVFCAIVGGQEPASVVFSDDSAVAFLDIHPVNPGHLLVVPRAHAESLGTLDERLGARMFTVAHRLASAVRASGLRCEGVHLSLADGEAAGQEVNHVHLHVVPRFAGDAFRIQASWLRPDRADLDRAAALIRQGLGPAQPDSDKTY